MLLVFVFYHEVVVVLLLSWLLGVDVFNREIIVINLLIRLLGVSILNRDSIVVFLLGGLLGVDVFDCEVIVFFGSLLVVGVFNQEVVGIRLVCSLFTFFLVFATRGLDEVGLLLIANLGRFGE